MVVGSSHNYCCNSEHPKVGMRVKFVVFSLHLRVLLQFKAKNSSSGVAAVVHSCSIWVVQFKVNNTSTVVPACVHSAAI